MIESGQLTENHVMCPDFEGLGQGRDANRLVDPTTGCLPLTDQQREQLIRHVQEEDQRILQKLRPPVRNFDGFTPEEIAEVQRLRSMEKVFRFQPRSQVDSPNR